EWHDERLHWSPENYSGLAVLRVPCQKLWLPDIVLYNSADDFTTGYMQSKAMVDCNGTVFWPPPAKLRSTCKIDITYFPFDDQVCTMKFGSWTYDGFQVNITKKREEVDFENYVQSGEWNLIRVDVERQETVYPISTVPYPDIKFHIVIQRRTLYYLFNIIFPCLWLTVLSLLSFWLPPDSGEKITLGITVLLAFSVFMLLIAENMPATSEFVPLIACPVRIAGIYLTVTMSTTSLSIVLTVFVLHLHHIGPNDKPLPRWLRRFLFKRLAPLLCMTSVARYQRKARRKRRELRQLDDSDQQPAVDDVTDEAEDELETATCTTTASTFRQQHQLRQSIRLDRHIRRLMRQQLDDEAAQLLISDWRTVAYVMDRLLFWLFLTAAFTSTLVILVVMPLFKKVL
uniref:Neur_chan_LBD domain-containing protein n=1 Tax=Macrostomum lignano TaxID=282301 RepID=A0A1I8G3V5_9PLAT